jgi:3'-5' exoribonuclease
MPSHTISELKKAVRDGSSCTAEIHAQIEKLLLKETSNGKPFFEVILRDAGEGLTLKAWNDSAAFEACGDLAQGDFVRVAGTFAKTPFGTESRDWRPSLLEDDRVEALLMGSSDRRALLERCDTLIRSAVDGITDPRLGSLCSRFLELYGNRFRRAAAARGNHHARRGGLLEHTARMMEAAMALCSVYPELNRDLVVAGVLFHDSGKLWETCPPERGFGIETESRGELLGHVSVGIELVNTLWREVPKEDWEDLSPPSEEVRLHLLHLVASHHGQLEFGAPVLPKTPEAALLHFVDNIDARMEMFFAAGITGSTGTREWVKPLGVVPFPPLPAFAPPATQPDPVTESPSDLLL